MTLTVTLKVHENLSGQVEVTAVAENPTDESIRIGSSDSQLYEVVACSDSTSHYGQSYGYMQAPHHLTLPPKESVVFSRTFERQQDIRDDLDEDVARRLSEEINFLTPEIQEEVTATIKVFEQGTNEVVEDTTTFIPSELRVRETEAVIESLRSYPLTDESIELG